MVNLIFATASLLPDSRGLGRAIVSDLKPLNRGRARRADGACALAAELAGHLFARPQLLLVLPEGESEAVARGPVDEQNSAEKAIDLLHGSDHRFIRAGPFGSGLGGICNDSGC